MKYQSTNDGLLALQHVREGMVITIIEEAYVTTSQTNGKEYWNAKVELPDGSRKLANVGGITGDLFLKAWGDDTKNWIGKSATVSMRISKATGNGYFVLVPVEGQVSASPQHTLRDVSRPAQAAPTGSILPPEDQDEIDPKDIPF